MAQATSRKVDAEPEAIEATLNYIVDDGTKVFTETGAPGATDAASPIRAASPCTTAGTATSRSSTTAFISSPTTPRSRTSSTRPKCGASTIRRWKRW
jgi:hypothetical protein